MPATCAGLSFAPDGSTLLSAGRDRQIKLWRPDSYAETRALGGDGAVASDDAVLSARFSADGKRIVTAGRDRAARLWDADTLQTLAQFAEGHEFLASSAVFFDSGTKLATGAGDGSVRIWDVSSGAEVQKLAPAGAAAPLDVSPDGRWIATGGPQNTARLWDALRGELVAELSAHDAEVTAICFAPDGQLVATGDQRGVARLWRRDETSNRWQPGAWLRGHSRTITAMALIDNGGACLPVAATIPVGNGTSLRARS